MLGKGMVINMEDCLFCKIVAGETPSKKVYEDDKVYAFRDIAPQAPVHVVIVPKEHVMSSMNDYDETKGEVIAAIFGAVKKIAESEGIAESGYRLISNCGSDAAQTVKHLHFHLLGGKFLGENIC